MAKEESPSKPRQGKGNVTFLHWPPQRHEIGGEGRDMEVKERVRNEDLSIYNSKKPTLSSSLPPFIILL